MLKPELISKANGLFTLATVIATVIGMVIGNWLADHDRRPRASTSWWLSAVGADRRRRRSARSPACRSTSLPPGDPTRQFPWDAPQQTWRDLTALGQQPAAVPRGLGIAFFYAVGALAQLNIDQLAAEGGGAAPNRPKARCSWR